MVSETSRNHMRNRLKNNLLSFKFDFEMQMWDTYVYQYQHNDLYRQFCDLLGRSPHSISSTEDIPFLPISTFKQHRIQSGSFVEELVFQSSGTTLQNKSQHFIRDVELYNQISTHLFEDEYGPLEDFVVLALLPSYLEQGGSSLVHMVSHFIHKSRNEKSQFFKYNFKELSQTVQELLKGDQKILCIGVSYAMLDFAMETKNDWTDRVIVMETGGMKGRRKEMLRSELHFELKNQLGVDQIHSEYGMTEMMSQLYAPENGLFKSGVTAKLIPFEVNDPLSRVEAQQVGRSHIVDLANLDSCSFVASDDMIRVMDDNRIDIIGRIDHSDIRGCNLLYV